MFEPVLNFLKALSRNLGRVAEWLWDNVVPLTVKEKFKDMLPSGGVGGMVSFVFQIFLHWYFYIVIAGLIVVYRLFKVLKEKGILDKFENIMYDGMEGVFTISKTCFPLITEYKVFLGCFMNAGIGY